MVYSLLEYPTALRLGPLILFVSAVLVAACDAPPDEPEMLNQPSPSATATPIPQPRATRSPAFGTPTPTATPAFYAAVPEVSFAPPAATSPPVVRTLGPAPPPQPRPDVIHTVVYDVAGRRTIDLGPGSIGSFSPDSRLMAWNPAEPRDELWVINLETGEKWSPGPGRAPSFVNPRTVRVFVRATPQERESQVNIDVYTGERVPEPSSTTPGAAAAPRTWDVREAWQAVDGRHFLVTDAQGKPVLKFDGLEFRLVGNDELLVARMLQAEEVSFYLVHLPSGAPAFLGRFRFDPASSGPQVFLMTATDRYILWHAYCSDINPGLYDRRTGVLTEISVGEMGRGLYARLTSNNLVGLGSFGPDALVDPVTLEYVFAVPTYDASTGYGYGDVRWSPNYRYASQGTFGGHGGLCG